MDRRLPHRIREVRHKFVEDGKTVDSESVRVELCRKHPQYNRIKQQALKRLITQELSTPAPIIPSAEAKAGGGGTDGSGKRRKRKHAAEGRQDLGTEEGEPPGEGKMNGTLRKMYQRGAEEGADTGAPAASASTGAGAAARRAALARERAARAAARRELGLPEPQAAVGFQPQERPEERLHDLGGIDEILADIQQLVVHPLMHPEVFVHLGVQPPTGVLLHGPPGSGKTKLAHAIAGTTGVAFFKVAATEIVSGMSGESEAKIRQLFQAAMAAAPSLLFLDEVDAITPRRDSAGREMERRIVAQLLTCLDELQNTNVMVMGATNRPDALDPALRRAGRFDREIAMGIPDEAARARILEKMTSGMRLAGDLDIATLAKLTPGYVGADLSALTKEAALGAVCRAFADLRVGEQKPSAESLEGSCDVVERPYTAEEMERLAVEMQDFHTALPKVQPSARREGFTTVPEVTWEDVGALDDIRGDLDAAVCEPIRKAELFKQLGLQVPCGVLLYGPPGCGKTLLAKATANASGANFIAVKGPELLNKYVGESERAVRLVFQRASASSPCVIFFDELDALVPRRSSEGSTSSERVVNQMLTEMDGVHQRSQVYVIAATNRPDIVDPAMLRPGRLDRLLFVPLPSEAGRLEILRAHTRKLPLAEDVDLPAIAAEADGFSGADLAALAREAAMLAIRLADVPRPSSQKAIGAPPAGDGNAAAVAEDSPTPSIRITAMLLARARERVSASVGAEERKEYEDLNARLSGSRCAPRKDGTLGR